MVTETIVNRVEELEIQKNHSDNSDKKPREVGEKINLKKRFKRI